MALTVLLVAGGCSAGLRDAATKPATASEGGLLYSVVSPSLVVTLEGDGFRITVPATAPTAWFTDRPDRTAGNMIVSDLVSLWEAEGFVDDPPNAAVVVTVGGEQHQLVVELTDPRSGSADIVSFHAVDIGDARSSGPVAGRRATHVLAVGTFGESELFIDDGSTAPCPTTITTISTTCLLPAKASTTISIGGKSSGLVVGISKSGTGSRRGAMSIDPCGQGWSISADASSTQWAYNEGQALRIGGDVANSVSLSLGWPKSSAGGQQPC